jgi:DNA-binding PadR family transcriptional regulator
MVERGENPLTKLESALQTREQRFRQRKWDKMFVSRALITSKAFLSLKTASACKVLMIFLSKCQVEKLQTRPGCRDKEWVITNNGEIQFTYIEAEEKYGLSSGKFTRAIDELLEKGLIEITKSGFGLQRDVTLYAISNRWEKYGTDEFVSMERPKRIEKLGFRKGNKYGKRKSQQSPVAAVQQLPIAVEK